MNKDFMDVKVKKFNMKKVSLMVSIFSLLFICLLSFSLNIFKSSAEVITPVGDPIYVDGNKKYYINCYTENDMNVSASPSLLYVYPLASDNSLQGYCYSDGLLVLDGEGTIISMHGSYFKSTCPSSNITKVVVSKNGFKPSGSLAMMFEELTTVKTIDLEGFDTTNVTNIDRMFFRCLALEELNLGSKFTCASVTSTEQLFYNCNKLESINLSMLKSTITDATEMFASCSSLVSIDFGTTMSINTPSFAKFFSGLSALTSLDLTVFDSTNSTSTKEMFNQCTNLKSITFGNKFTCSSVTDMSYMFNECSSLQGLDISKFNTGLVSDMSYMFNKCLALTDINFGESFNVKNVTNMDYMFNTMTTIKNLDLSCFVFDSPTKLNTSEYMFYCSKLEYLNFEGWDFSGCECNIDLNGSQYLKEIIMPKAINTSYSLQLNSALSREGYMLFDYGEHVLNNNTYGFGNDLVNASVINGNVGRNNGKLYKIKKVDTVLYEDTTKRIVYCRTGVESYGSFLRNPSYEIPMVTIDLSNGKNTLTAYYYYAPTSMLILDGVGEYKDTSGMSPFINNEKAKDVKNVIVSKNGFKVTNETSIEGMFKGLAKLETVDLEGFDSSNVTSLKQLFEDCSKLKSVKFGSKFDVSNVTTIEAMFNRCHALTDINFGNSFDLSKTTSMYMAFEECKSLIDLDLSSFVTSDKLTDMRIFVHYCTSLETLKLGNGFNTTNVTNYGNSFGNCDKLKYLELTGLDSADITSRWNHYIISDLTDLAFIYTPETLPDETSDVVVGGRINLPKKDVDGIWLGIKGDAILPNEFTTLVTKDVCDALLYIPSRDIEKQMMDYQLLDADTKEKLNTYKEYKTYLNNLNTQYYTLMDSKKCDTKKDIANKDENIEIFGVVNNTKEEASDSIKVKVTKIVDKDEIKDLKEEINNSSDPLASGEEILVPYDIRLFCNTEEIHETKDKLIVKLELPIAYYDSLLNVFRNHDGVINKLVEKTGATSDGEMWREILTINGVKKFNLYFLTDKFSDYVLTTDKTSLVISSMYDDKVNASKNYVSTDAQIPFDEDGNASVNVILEVDKTKAEVYNGSTLIKTLTKANNTFTISKDSEHLTDNVYLTVKFIDISKPDNGAGGNTGSITTQTITIQVSDHNPYIDGYSDKTFRPNNSITRAEFAKVISTISNNFAMSYDNDKYVSKYTDVEEGEWFSNYVGYVTKTGLMKGYTDGTFKPNEYITRAEVSKVLSDMFTVPDKQIKNTFLSELDGHWYFNCINELVKGGLIKGYEDGTFKPNNNITRAEAVTLINRVKDREIVKDIEKGYLNIMDSRFKDVSESD